MSSGLNWDEHYASLTSQTTEAYYGNRLYRQMMRLEVVSPPGRQFDYMSCNTQLLGYILRNIADTTVSAYASEKLWGPLNAVHDARWSLARKGGAEKAYCCLYSNARDFARIGKLYLDSGRWNGRQVVPESYVLESLRPAPLLDAGSPNRQYGFHWWLGEAAGRRFFYARGILGQYVIAIPGEDLIIVRLGHLRNEGPDRTLLDVPLYVGEVIKAFARREPAILASPDA
jgi:CubicO group peptidase (beta-lactamase class C family)